MCIYLVNSNKKGISSCQLANQVGITQKSAWFFCKELEELVFQKILTIHSASEYVKNDSRVAFKIHAKNYKCLLGLVKARHKRNLLFCKL